MNRKMIVCIVLCLVLVLSSAGCQSKKGVDLPEKLNALAVSDEDLGIRGKYTALSDVTDGSVDPDLVGKWISADGRTAYTYDADGAQKIESEDFGNYDVRFTCLTCGSYKIICEESPMTSTDADGNTAESTVLSYMAYSVENDALYMVAVEAPDPDFTTSQNALVTMYRAGKDGTAAEAMAKNPIALSCLDGTWTCEKGEFTIADGKLTCGSESGVLSFNDENQLVVEKDGQTTAYSMNLSLLSDYDANSTATVLGLYYTGKDENDQPNLLSLLDDWKTEYDWENWYYTGSFELQK